MFSCVTRLRRSSKVSMIRLCERELRKRLEAANAALAWRGHLPKVLVEVRRIVLTHACDVSANEVTSFAATLTEPLVAYRVNLDVYHRHRQVQKDAQWLSYAKEPGVA